MTPKLLNTREDMQWLAETHFPQASAFLDGCALLYGNEDCPDKVDLWHANNPPHDQAPDLTVTADYEPRHLKLWTMPDDYAGEVWPAYYSAGVGQSRDSDALERSNFTCMLRELGGESDTVRVVHEGHWAVGWVEWIAIHQDDAASLQIADKIQGALKDYPVVDEDHFSELEYTEAADFWESLSPREKVRMAMEARAHYHWLAKTPVWRFGRMSYYDLGNDESEIAQYLLDTLRG